MKFPRITWRRLLAVVGLLFVIAVSGFVVWASITNPIMPQAEAALQTDANVTVSTQRTFLGGYIAFEPQSNTPQAGFILYPGGRVNPAAYAPLARALAEQGYMAAIVYVPLNLAILDMGGAGDVINAYPDVTTWTVGGHSLGGVAASRYANSHQEDIAGLVLMASLPFPGLSLSSRTDLATVSIYATLDGLLSVEDALAAADDLPQSTVFIPIEGGNHAQFGWYGTQSGDNEATISHEAQTEQIVAAIVTLLEDLAGE